MRIKLQSPTPTPTPTPLLIFDHLHPLIEKNFFLSPPFHHYYHETSCVIQYTSYENTQTYQAKVVILIYHQIRITNL